MNAQKIYCYMKELNPIAINLKKDITPECVEPFHKLFETVSILEPVDLWRKGGDRFLWIKAPRGSYEEFCGARKNEYGFVEEGSQEFRKDGDVKKMEEDWPILYPDEEDWYGLKLAEHRGNRAIFLNQIMLVHVPADQKDWKDYHEFCQGQMDIRPLLAWMQSEAERCIAMLQAGTYMNDIRENLPLYARNGYLPCKEYWNFVPDDFDHTFGRMDFVTKEEFFRWVDTCSEQEQGVEHFTSGSYYHACRQYYEVTGMLKPEDKDKTDRELYLRYCDGRDGGLRELDVDSEEEFANWFHNGCYEHHVWELDRAHKWLRVLENNGKYTLTLSFHGDWETYRLLPIVLQLVKRGVPIAASHYKRLADRMRGGGWVEIVPVICDYHLWSDPFEEELDENEAMSIVEKRQLPYPIPEGMAEAVTWNEIPEVRLKK